MIAKNGAIRDDRLGNREKMRFLYTVWLTDPMLPADDPDYEWPACFLIDGRTETTAKKWGDHVSTQYVIRHGGTVVRSEVEALEKSTLQGLDQLPVIMEGYEATDEEIGW